MKQLIFALVLLSQSVAFAHSVSSNHEALQNADCGPMLSGLTQLNVRVNETRDRQGQVVRINGKYKGKDFAIKFTDLQPDYSAQSQYRSKSFILIPSQVVVNDFEWHRSEGEVLDSNEMSPAQIEKKAAELGLPWNPMTLIVTVEKKVTGAELNQLLKRHSLIELIRKEVITHTYAGEILSDAEITISSYSSMGLGKGDITLESTAVIRR